MKEEDAAISPGSEELVRVLAEHGENSSSIREKLRELRDSDLPTFLRVTLGHLGLGVIGPGEIQLSQMLAEQGEYVDALTDPDLLTEDVAVTAASFMAHEDPEFHSRLMEMRRSTDQRRIHRILQIISRDDRAMALIPWLRNLVDGGNSLLASKAAKILCRLTKNPMVMEKFLRSGDARVRANAVEGLWGGNVSRTRPLLRQAAADNNHRVAVNALVELCRCGESLARERIVELARHPNPLFRAAIAWAIGEIATPDLLPTLELLKHDSALSVRLRAGRTAKRLRMATGEATSEAAAGG